MMIERVPPHDLDMEASLLGALFANPDVYDDVVAIIGLEDVFYLPAHTEIFKAIADMRKDNRPIDAVTLQAELSARNMLERAGGLEYIINIHDACPDWRSAEYYADEVLKKHKQRQLIRLSGQLGDAAYSLLCDPDMESAKFATLIEAVSTNTKVSTVQHLKDIMEDTRKALGSENSPVGHIPTGIVPFDDKTGGLPKGCYTVLAAAPSVGKTSMALAWSVRSAIESVPVLFVSVEMSKERLAMRAVSMMTGASTHDVEYPHDDEARDRLFASAARNLRLEEIGLWITDCTKQIERIVALGRAYARVHNVGLIVVDYLQLVTASGKYDNNTHRVTEISHALKGLSTDTNAAVLVLSQFSNEVIKAGREPTYADLRDSGMIGADADMVVLLAAKPIGSKDDQYPERDVVMIVGKNRNGPTGRIRLTFHKADMTFRHHVAAVEACDYDETPF